MYIYVLDFCSTRLVELKIPDELQELETNVILDKFGFKESQCGYLITGDSLDLERMDAITNPEILKKK